MDKERLPIIFQHAKKARETGLFAWLDMGVLRVSGADAPTFLHSQLTNEVKALQPGEGNLSARVSRTGTLLRYFSLHRLYDSVPAFLLLLERDGVAALRADLEKFAIADDVTFDDVTDNYNLLALQGPKAAELAEASFGKLAGQNWPDLPENAARELRDADVPVGTMTIARPLTGDPGFIIAFPKLPAVSRDELIKPVAMQAMTRGVVYLEGADLTDVMEILRVEAGVVRVGPDAAEGKLVLPETGIEGQTVSYAKGCYLGQEVIARIRTYGSLPHVLRGVIFDGAGATPEEWLAFLARVPAVGADVVLENGAKAGQWASRSISPVLEAPVAFAYLDRANRTPGTKLKLRDAQGNVLAAQVALLPFYKASDLKARVTFLHDRAIQLFAGGKDDKAIEMLIEALRLDPSFADAYEALGVIMGRTGRFHDAIDIFKRLEEIAPNEPMVHTNLSLYYMKLGDKTAAEEEKAKATVKQFSRFGSMKKDEQKAAEEEQKKREDAIRKKAMFEEVIEIDPEDPIALFGLGNALSTLGMWDGAERTLAKACAVQKDNSACFLAHGKTLEMLGRETDAVNVYKAGMAVASKKGDLMPLKEMERRVILLEGAAKKPTA